MKAVPRHDDLDSAGGSRRTPQQLLIAFFGAMVLDRDRDFINAQVYLQVLADLGVGESAARATLSRMVRTGFLHRIQSGRTAAFGLTARARELLRHGSDRVDSPAPFTPTSDDWTLLSYSVPETRRDLRHKLRSQLLWAGFGRLRDGLWIAPGVVDVDEIIAMAGSSESVAVAFAGRPLSGMSPAEFIPAAWDLSQIAAEHAHFIGTWRHVPPESDPLATYTALVADWLHLLRQAPRLPVSCLPQPWPADESVTTFAAATARLREPANKQLDAMLSAWRTQVSR